MTRVNEKELANKPLVWLCLDPGITTGMAVLDDAGELRASTVWGTGEIADNLDAIIRGLHISGYGVHVVIEKMPPGSYGSLAAKLEDVRRVIYSIVQDTYELPITAISPGEWKPSRAAKTAVVKSWRFAGTPMMTHQRDAFKMGRYAIDKASRA
jgi:hypothetical protein